MAFESTIINKERDYEYMICLNKNHADNGVSFIVPIDAQGFIIGTKSNSDPKIHSFGKVDHHVIGDTRMIVMDVEEKNDYTINNKSFKKDTITWINGNDFFIQVKNNKLTIDMIRNGFYCFENSILFEVKHLTIDDSIRLGEKSKKGIKNIWFNGKHYSIESTNMFTLTKGENRDILRLDPVISQTDRLYVEYSNGHFADVEMVDFNPKVVMVYEDQNLKPFENFKVQIMSDIKEDDKRKISLTKKNGDFVSYSLDEIYVSKLKEKLLFLEIPTYHEKHNPKVNLRDFDVNQEIVTVDDKEQFILELNEQRKEYVCVLKNGDKFNCILAKYNYPYTLVDSGVLRFSLQDPTELNSDYLYMVDDNLYEFPVNETFFSSYYNGKNLTLTLKPGVNSVSVFDKKSQQWKVYKTYLNYMFNDSYTVNVFGTGSIFNMEDFGMKDSKEKIEWFYTEKDKEPKNIKNNKLKIDVPENVVPGELIKTYKITAKIRSVEVYFELFFIYETYNNVFFYYKDDDIFGSTPTRRRVSKRSFSSDVFTYGIFVGNINSELYVYNTKVDSMTLPLVKNSFPIIKFEESNVGSIRVSNYTMPINTKILTEDFMINDVKSYVRLNNCSNVIYNGITVTVPFKTSTCFFKANDELYLLKSQMPTSISFNGTSPDTSRPGTPFQRDLKTNEKKIIIPTADAGKGAAADIDSLSSLKDVVYVGDAMAFAGGDAMVVTNTRAVAGGGAASSTSSFKQMSNGDVARVNAHSDASFKQGVMPIKQNNITLKTPIRVQNQTPTQVDKSIPVRKMTVVPRNVPITKINKTIVPVTKTVKTENILVKTTKQIFTSKKFIPKELGRKNKVSVGLF